MSLGKSSRPILRTRRPATTLVALALLAAAPGLAAGAVSSSSAGAATLPSVRAVAADRLADSFGVCVHVGFLDTPYKDATVVRDAVAGLGVRHVRDELTLNTPWQYASMRTVAQSGAKFDLITGNPTQDAPSAYVSTVASELPGVVESLEGTNEWDISGRPDWVSELRARQQDLYAAAKADPATASLPVLSPSLAFPWNWDAAGDFSSMADLTNGHLYPGGRNPSFDLDTSVPHLLSLVGGKPLVTTETGYHNALASTATNADGHPMVPEDVSATYLPRSFLEGFAHGAVRTYGYELIDEFDDPAMTNPEAHFGLLRHDLSPKPAYTAVKNLLRLVADPGTSPQTPGTLAYAVTGGDSSLRQQLVQRRDGHFVLLLWRDVSVWDTATRTRTAVTPSSLTVTLGLPSTVQVYRPNDQATPVSTTTSTMSVPLSLGAQVAALDISPAPLPVVKPPTSVAAVAGTRAATVGWRNPVGQIGVTAMRVYRSPGDVTTTLAPGATSLKVSGLTPGVRYTFSVRTVTSTSASVWVSALPVTAR